MASTINRRAFLKQSSLGALGISILPFTKPGIAPSDKLRVAHIGVNGMGTAHLKWFASLPEVEVVALADVDEMHLRKAMGTLKELQPNTQAKGYEDFRHILDRPDVDAITCATPDHWHAQVAILAFEAGKDVYGEKPLSYSVREGQVMLKSMKKHNRIFQLGTQIHAGDNYHRVVEIIRSGAIGKVHTVRLWKDAFSPSLGFPANETPPSTLNWDMWLGPAPYVPYNPMRCHFNFRYFMDYSGGMYQDFWCHIADVAFWALNPQGLKSISARGEKPQDGIADVPKWIDVDYEFENLKLHWTTQPPDVPGASEHNIGAYFEGDKGTLLCDYNNRVITIDRKAFTDLPEVSQSIPRSPGHQQNFVDAVKSRTQPESNLEYARQMTLPMHLGLISFQLGRKLEWNTQKEKFIKDREANKMLKRKYRKPWNLV